MVNKLYIFFILLIPLICSAQQNISEIWSADNGNGTYTNPILHFDYSDPDVVKVGNDYYMVASSFNCVPAIPVLHSNDLVNWEQIGYALKRLVPDDVFKKVQHGKGVWAPCIRYYNNEFYVFYPDPDFGIYMIKSPNAEGPWSEPVLVKAGKGLIDPSPFWDDDGKVYLVHAFAGSRAGVKSVLIVSRLNNDATKVIGNDVMIFDGHDENPTVEGPKFYKRNGYYYIFAPAGGVTFGWQLVLRSKNIYGPYEVKKVLAQGNSSVNGPHQGAWVTTNSGEDWFIHFQEKEAYGRIVHLQPMNWINDWPVIGVDDDNDGCGEPVKSYKKPDVGKQYEAVAPPVNDEFNTYETGLQWQWQANPDSKWGYPSGNLGYFRLNCIPKPEEFTNLRDMPNLFLQKLPAKGFEATTKITFHLRFDGEEAGFIVMGEDYQYISVKRESENNKIRVVNCPDADKGNSEIEQFSNEISESTIWLKITVKKGAVCNFAYSTDGKDFNKIGNSFNAKAGTWIGAKIGYFALREGFINDSGNIDIDWFRVVKK